MVVFWCAYAYNSIHVSLGSSESTLFLGFSIISYSYNATWRLESCLFWIPHTTQNFVCESVSIPLIHAMFEGSFESNMPWVCLLWTTSGRLGFQH